MTRSDVLKNAALLTVIWYVLLPSPAHAYFDVGTGTYMLQLIFGFGAAFFLSFRQAWTRRFRKPAQPAAIDKSASPTPAEDSAK